MSKLEENQAEAASKEVGQVLFEYDPGRHLYFANGKVIHSVTQVGQGFQFNHEAVFLETRFYNTSGRDRGTDVHTAIEMINRGVVKVEHFLGADRWGYIQAYGRFLEETGFRPVHVEAIGFHDSYGYCGTIDMVGKIGEDYYLIDVKTGSPTRWYGVQLAAYARILSDQKCMYFPTDEKSTNGFICKEVRNEAYGKTIKRRLLYVRESGRYTFDARYRDTPLDSPSWDQAWGAAITLKNWAA